MNGYVDPEELRAAMQFAPIPSLTGDYATDEDFMREVAERFWGPDFDAAALPQPDRGDNVIYVDFRARRG